MSGARRKDGVVETGIAVTKRDQKYDDIILVHPQ
jgi:hypothetical protein